MITYCLLPMWYLVCSVVNPNRILCHPDSVQFSFEVVQLRLWLTNRGIPCFHTPCKCQEKALAAARIICYLVTCRLQKLLSVSKRNKMNSGNIVVGLLVVRGIVSGSHIMAFRWSGPKPMAPGEWNLGSQNELQDALKRKDNPPPICSQEAMLRLTKKAGLMAVHEGTGYSVLLFLFIKCTRCSCVYECVMNVKRIIAWK